MPIHRTPNPAPPRAQDVPALWSWLRSLPAALRLRALAVAAEVYVPGGAL